MVIELSGVQLIWSGIIRVISKSHESEHEHTFSLARKKMQFRAITP